MSGDLLGGIHEMRFSPVRLREARECCDMGDVDDFLAEFVRSSSGSSGGSR